MTNQTQTQIDTQKLISSVEAKIDGLVYEDSYGSGVALTGDGTAYATWADLAAAYGLDVDDYRTTMDEAGLPDW